MRLAFDKQRDSTPHLHAEEGWQTRVLLTWMRLVHAGKVHERRRGNHAWRERDQHAKSQVAVLAWEGAMPGERCAKFSHAREEEVSTERGVTSGAASVIVRRQGT